MWSGVRESVPIFNCGPATVTKSVTALGSLWQFFTPENPSELIELYSELGMKLKSNKIKALAAFSPGSSSFKNFTGCISLQFISSPRQRL